MAPPDGWPLEDEDQCLVLVFKRPAVGSVHCESPVLQALVRLSLSHAWLSFGLGRGCTERPRPPRTGASSRDFSERKTAVRLEIGSTPAQVSRGKESKMATQVAETGPLGFENPM